MPYKLVQNLFKRGMRPDGDAGMKAYLAEKERVGGLFHFTVSRHEDGWTAECDEVEEIITGGTNPNPSNGEIEDNIREAIYAAFNIKSKEVSRPIYNITDSEAVYSFTDERNLVCA